MSAEGRVENQKLNQTAALLSFGWVFGFQLDSLEKHLITLAVVTFIQIASLSSDFNQSPRGLGIGFFFYQDESIRLLFIFENSNRIYPKIFLEKYLDITLLL